MLSVVGFTGISFVQLNRVTCLFLLFFRGCFSRDRIGKASKDGRLLGQGVQGGSGKARIKKACVERFSFRTPTNWGNLKHA